MAVAFWVAGTSKYGLSGGDSFAYHLEEEWVRPTTLFLAIALLAGLFHVFFRGWRWVAFGTGVIAGALTVGLLDLGWTFLYLVSQGS